MILAVAGLLGGTFARGQAVPAPQEKPQMADDIFKNIQVRKLAYLYFSILFR
jgi:hypothetical protein